MIGGEAACVCKLPGALGGRCFWNPEQLFGSPWQSGCGADVNTGGCGQEGKGSPGVPSVSCGVQHQISRGHREAKPKEPASEYPDVNPLQVPSHKHGSWHHWPKKPKVREAPCDPWAVPTHLSKAARRLDGGREPPLPQQVCKQGQRCRLRNPEVHSWGPGLPDVAGAVEAPFQVGGDGLRLGLSPLPGPPSQLL